jgi:hypothetical protein
MHLIKEFFIQQRRHRRRRVTTSPRWQQFANKTWGNGVRGVEARCGGDG